MSALHDALADWTDKEAPRDVDGNLTATRFDFFEAGYRRGTRSHAENGGFITDEAAGVEFTKNDLDYIRRVLTARDDGLKVRAEVLRKITRLQDEGAKSPLVDRIIGVGARVGEDMACPIRKVHCDDECCTVGSICNLSSEEERER